MATKTTKASEVFGMPSDHAIEALGPLKPSVSRGIVKIRRFKVTIEEIEEPIEVLHERLRKLHKHHLLKADKNAVEKAARALGLELTPEAHS